MPFPVTFAAECESCKKLTSLHKKGNYQLTKNRSTCNFFTRRAFETQRLANVPFLKVLPENCVKSRLEEVNFWKSNWKVNAYSCSELSSMYFKHSSSDASNSVYDEFYDNGKFNPSQPNVPFRHTLNNKDLMVYSKLSITS